MEVLTWLVEYSQCELFLLYYEYSGWLFYSLMVADGLQSYVFGTGDHRWAQIAVAVQQLSVIDNKGFWHNKKIKKAFP